jgi:hypothetical protein
MVADDKLWRSYGTTLRLIVGWFSVTIGTLNLLVDLDADGPYVLFHAVLLVGGVLLLALGRIGPNPGVAGYSAFGAALGGGTLISAIPLTTTVCCMPAYSFRHGFPFPFLARDEGGPWHVDSQHLLADLLFWGYVGLALLTVVSLARRGRSDARHAQHRRVGPLP